jgi:MFS superfamily sulfate permease-like transporter
MQAWMKKIIETALPFMRWFPITHQTLRADFVAGITVALVLIPQSMAYAQLAGLPVVYGLYASFVPVIVASLWGSSNQLHTGPVAMLSLMSAASLMSFATPGTTDFIQLSIMLALMVGVLRLLLGIFRLGAIVNLLSSPVIVGFTNAAALIIGLSQLSKVLGVPFPRSDTYLADLWQVIAQLPQVHWWTLAFAASAVLIIVALRHTFPRAPAVLVAVAITTLISAYTGYENKITIATEQIRDAEAVATLQAYSATRDQISSYTNQLTDNNQRASKLEKSGNSHDIREARDLRTQATVLQYELGIFKQENNARLVALNSIPLESVIDTHENQLFYRSSELPNHLTGDGKAWRFSSLSGNEITLTAGGAVVGAIPQGLPGFEIPVIDIDLMIALLPAAMVMALIGFMEATSISKAIATSTGDRINTNKELIGQGLANIAGSFFGSYTVSGSFSRSAVASRTGARTGLFAIISALAVVAVLIAFTSYLYHLPQAVLAVIVMMAVFSLIRITPLIHAWKVDRIGASIGVITFFATLLLAPAIANGILLGIALTVLHYLIRTMKPRVEIVGRKSNGTLGGILSHRLQPISEHFVPVRFDGSLSFANVAYFEDMILESHARFPGAKVILVIGSGINVVDASGVEKIREVARRLNDMGIQLAFSSLKLQVMNVFERSGLTQELGKDVFFTDKETALHQLSERYHAPATAHLYKVDSGSSITDKLAYSDSR